jgi:predicted branched-subunit amino acid permease
VTGSEDSRYRDGARLIAPIAFAAAAFGASFGILAPTADFDGVAAVVMSATTFAGSAQFAVVSTLDAGGTVAAAIVAAVLLNARYAPISVSVAPVFRGSLWRRLLESQLIVDESWVVSWGGATTVGALVGEAIADPASLGLDAAFPALFLALLVPQVRSRRAFAAALLAAGVALVLIPFAPAGIPIIAASAACLLGWRWP